MQICSVVFGHSEQPQDEVLSTEVCDFELAFYLSS